MDHTPAFPGYRSALALGLAGALVLCACGKSKSKDGDKPNTAHPTPSEPAPIPKPEPKPEPKPTDPPENRGNEIPAAYRALMAARCDLAQLPAMTPIDARILGLTPFALAGRPFQEPELASLFAGDGNWYKPGPSPEVKISPADTKCVASLQAAEKVLRERMPVDEEIELRLTNLQVFRELRKRATPGVEYKHGSAQKGDGQWTWKLIESTCADPSAGAGCKGLSLTCSGGGGGEMQCVVADHG